MTEHHDIPEDLKDEAIDSALEVVRKKLRGMILTQMYTSEEELAAEIVLQREIAKKNFGSKDWRDKAMGLMYGIGLLLDKVNPKSIVDKIAGFSMEEQDALKSLQKKKSDWSLREMNRRRRK